VNALQSITFENPDKLSVIISEQGVIRLTHVMVSKIETGFLVRWGYMNHGQFVSQTYQLLDTEDYEELAALHDGTNFSMDEVYDLVGVRSVAVIDPDEADTEPIETDIIRRLAALEQTESRR
jgi:hypothetical protein